MAGSERRGPGPPSIGDTPSISESGWYVLAVTSALLTGLAVLVGFIWIFGDGFDGEYDLKKAQALSPFGVALFALVTFCTAGWRGAINTRQADQSENEGRAKLLQEGAKLLGENGKAAHISAGIATLGVLISGSDKSYALQAMNLLADFVEDHMRFGHANRHLPQISSMMRNGDATGVNTGKHVFFEFDSDETTSEEDIAYWRFIPGFKLITYRGGIFPYDPEYELDALYGVEFQFVEIINWRSVHIDQRFRACTFVQCGVKSLDSLGAVSSLADRQFAFDRCDFSGCEINDGELLLIDLKRQGNFYHKESPPVLIGQERDIDWTRFLLCV